MPGSPGAPEEDWFGQDGRQFLTALRGIAESGRTPADEMLELYHGRWRGSVDPVLAESTFEIAGTLGFVWICARTFRARGSRRH